MVKVKNVPGSSRFHAPLGYSSWLDYWAAHCSKPRLLCSTCGCCRFDLVGAHVQKADSTDKKWYITPICHACNNRTDEFYVEGELIPVPTNL